MKKFISLVLILALCCSLTACYFGGENDSNGNDSQALYMPDFVNADVFGAEQRLLELNIAYEIIYEVNPYYEDNRVISQSIAPGTELLGGEFVTLVVCQGEIPCPYDYTQKLVVSAAVGSSYANASLYEWYDGDWQLMASYSATVGSNGIGRPYEGSKRTPQGLFKLGVVLSAQTLNTNLNTYRASSTTCVVDEPYSPYYNCIMDRSSVPYGTSYDQIGKGLNNGSHYAFIYIEHNGTGLSSDGVVANAGSVMGVRGTYKSLAPTFGDVDISYRDMQDLLSRLDINKNPMIEITTN